MRAITPSSRWPQIAMISVAVAACATELIGILPCCKANIYRHAFAPRDRQVDFSVSATPGLPLTLPRFARVPPCPRRRRRRGEGWLGGEGPAPAEQPVRNRLGCAAVTADRASCGRAPRSA